MQVYVGTICVFGFNFAPYQWAFCNGQLMAISQNTALFSLLGTYYGGNGTSNFALPNLQGRVSNSQGQLAGGSTYVIGEMAGSETTTILSSNMPAHNHPLTFSINVNNTTQTGASPAATFPAVAATTKVTAASSVAGKFMANPTVTLGTSGGTVPISITDPSLVMNYCISLYGIYPTRN